MDDKKKIETVCCELLNACTEKGLTISEMFELSREFPRVIRKQINSLERTTIFKVNFGSDIQE